MDYLRNLKAQHNVRKRKKQREVERLQLREENKRKILHLAENLRHFVNDPRYEDTRKILESSMNSLLNELLTVEIKDAHAEALRREINFIGDFLKKPKEYFQAEKAIKDDERTEKASG